MAAQLMTGKDIYDMVVCAVRASVESAQLNFSFIKISMDSDIRYLELRLIIDKKNQVYQLNAVEITEDGERTRCPNSLEWLRRSDSLFTMNIPQ